MFSMAAEPSSTHQRDAGSMTKATTAPAFSIHAPATLNFSIVARSVTTTKSHGCRLLPVAAKRPASTIVSRSDLGTASPVYRRVLLRLRIASKASILLLRISTTDLRSRNVQQSRSVVCESAPRRGQEEAPA